MELGIRDGLRIIVGGRPYHLEAQGADRVRAAAVRVHIGARRGSAQRTAFEEEAQVFGPCDLGRATTYTQNAAKVDSRKAASPYEVVSDLRQSTFGT